MGSLPAGLASFLPACLPHLPLDRTTRDRQPDQAWGLPWACPLPGIHSRTKTVPGADEW